MIIDCEFPGGNIIVEGIDGDVARIRQDTRDTRGHWFYWYFRVREAAGRTVQFRFVDGADGVHGQVVGPRGPAVSSDGGRSWRWLGLDGEHVDRFTCQFGADDHEVRFCLAVPYLDADFQAFVERLGPMDHLRVGELCRTRQGRPVRLLRVGRLDGQAPRRALITCRHHCCEMMANYELEGLVEGVLADDEVGRWLRGNVEFWIVPFMDTDGVECGDQGKNRLPRDHNRDYDPPCVHVETAAVMALAETWRGDGRQWLLDVALDMHCPGIRNQRNQCIFFFGPPDARCDREATRLSQIIEQVVRGPLPYCHDDYRGRAEAGKISQSSAAKVGMTFARWAGSLPSRLAATIEMPYADARGLEVTTDAARAFGRDLARALVSYLNE